jgi:uncharacterized protein YgbK (DUF1537 family)
VARPDPTLLVAADDRTGAIEAAGALAQRRGGAVAVITDLGRLDPRSTCTVVDLSSRHLEPAEAAERAARVESARADRHGHKIDSMLRGNWANELVSRHRRADRPVLVVPALPTLGRTCEDGTVFVRGVDVARAAGVTDVGHRPMSSRPGDHLGAAGATDVHHVAIGARLERWLAAPAGVAVCDASDTATLEAIGDLWRNGPPEVLLAGTSEAISLVSTASDGEDPPIALESPVLVVCGSLHPAARAQLTRLRRLPAPPPIVTTEVPDRDPDLRAARAAAASLAERVAATIADVRPRTVVVLGGDTAAAVLGDRTVLVGGMVAPGTAWCRRDDGGPVWVTRSGAFGGPDALVELVSGTLAT